MAEKVSIDGNIIGTTSDNVEYKKNNSQTVEDALDALFEGAGGGSTPTPIESAADVPYTKQGWDGVTNVKQALDDIDNDGLKELLQNLFETGRIYSGWWEYSTILAGAGGHPVYDNCDSNDYYIQPPQKDRYHNGAYFRVYKGDTLYYQDCGEASNYAVILTDLNNKVVNVAPRGISSNNPGRSSNLEGIEITHDGYAIVRRVAGAKAAVWVVSGRKTLKGNEKIYTAYGDSITAENEWPSSGSAYIGKAPICYPRIAATLLNADVRSCAGAGWNFTMILGRESECRADNDIVTILMGANDASQIARGGACSSLETTGSIESGTITATIPSAYIAGVLNTKGLIIHGDNVKVTGVSVNGVSKYTNAEGFALANNNPLRSTPTDGDGYIGVTYTMDLGTLSAGDVIAVSVVGVSGGTQSVGISTVYNVGNVADVMNNVNMNLYQEWYTTYLGRYRYFLNSLLGILKKPTVRIYCIGVLKNTDSDSESQDVLRENMRKGLKQLVEAIDDDRIVFVNGGTLIINTPGEKNDLWYDDLHPFTNGQVVIANTLATIIKENLALIE